MPTIIIRVGIAAQTLSKPWKGLVSNSKTITEKTISAVQRALQALELFLWCYIAVSTRVLEKSREVLLESPRHICEILLRFHRNGIADDIITAAFNENINNPREFMNAVSNCNDGENGCCAWTKYKRFWNSFQIYFFNMIIIHSISTIPSASKEIGVAFLWIVLWSVF